MSKTSNKKCILAVDDTAIILTRISNTLRDAYDVITVNSGERALKYLKEEKPDLILLDIKMSPLDGVETLNKIRTMKDREDIPVIMLTGVEDRDIVLKSARLGICDYILKPFSSDDLRKRIRRAFEQENQKQVDGDQIQLQDDQERVESDQKQAEADQKQLEDNKEG